METLLIFVAGGVFGALCVLVARRFLAPHRVDYGTFRKEMRGRSYENDPTPYYRGAFLDGCESAWDYLMRS